MTIESLRENSEQQKAAEGRLEEAADAAEVGRVTRAIEALEVDKAELYQLFEKIVSEVGTRVRV